MFDAVREFRPSVISRNKSILRRAELFAVTKMDDPIEIGSIKINPEQREVWMDNQQIELTPKEFELLLFLCKHRGKILSRQQLLFGVWDYYYIITVRNVGYKLKEKPPIRSLA